MRAPSVHSNGTSKEELLRQLRTAHDDLITGLNSLCAAAPHGRDYYVQDQPFVGPYGPAFDEATAQHAVRVQKVIQVITELSDLWLEVDKQ